MYSVALSFLNNTTIFGLGDKLLPVFKHGFLRSEENVNLNISNTRYCMSFGVSCNVMDTSDVL